MHRDREKDFVFIEQGPVSGRVVRVRAGTTIGREGCDVLLVDPEVSRVHAVIDVLDHGLVIRALESMNGTWVNGRRIRGPELIAAGDQLRFGNTVWRVET